MVNAVATAEIDDDRIRSDDQLDEAAQSIRILRYDESGVPAAERLRLLMDRWSDHAAFVKLMA
jgi:hypothetical protein